MSRHRALPHLALVLLASTSAGAAVAQEHVHAQVEAEAAPAEQAAHPHDAPPAPVPVPTDAERAAAFPVLDHAMQHADAINSLLRFDRLEAWRDDESSGQAWEIDGWLGSDTNRLWLRSVGERADGETHAANVELLYGHAITPWWDVVTGLRHDFQPQSAQTWAAFGVQGMAPWFIEVRATAYASDEGQVAAEFEAEHQARLTARWILESQLELALHGKDDAARGIGSGLSTAEAGLRLRYEFTPRFAPYFGVAWERRFGDTARYARAEGESVDGARLVGGLRFWF